MRVVFIGPPGSGKGTQSARLVEYLRVPHLSTGEMLRQALEANTQLGLQAAQYLSAGTLVPDPLILGLVTERLNKPDCQRGYLLDGFPRTLGQAQSLDAFLHHRHTPLSAVIELQVDPEQLIKRLSSRGRDDDQPDVIRERLAQYARQTAPLSDYYRRQSLLHSVEGMGTPEEVFDRIKAVVDQIPPTTSPDRLQ
jgi:adenylate kinase